MRVLYVAAACLLLFVSCGNDRTEPPAETAPFVLPGTRNYLTDFPAQNPDGTVNVVVEIPAGTTAKWEVTKPDGRLAWERRDGQPRRVRYLGYPGNYGMVPRTLLPQELGGDGDPLDVIVLGPAAERGAVLKVRVVGVLRLLDRGEQDDKLLAVMTNSAFQDVETLTELRQTFPGVTEILELWFANYKGPGKMVSQGYGEVDEARAILEAAVAAFAEQGIVNSE